jgi:hypothetical protein
VCGIPGGHSGNENEDSVEILQNRDQPTHFAAQNPKKNGFHKKKTAGKLVIHNNKRTLARTIQAMVP